VRLCAGAPGRGVSLYRQLVCAREVANHKGVGFRLQLDSSSVYAAHSLVTLQGGDFSKFSFQRCHVRMYHYLSTESL
jgi:hypothetical protein